MIDWKIHNAAKEEEQMKAIIYASVHHGNTKKVVGRLPKSVRLS
jgi:hypothetical protein